MSITLSDPDLPKVKIRINVDKCQTPMACSNPCYRICPQGVFVVAPNPTKSYKKWYTVDPNTPGDYTLIAPMVPKCTGCMLCVKNCPNKALKIKIKPVEKEVNEQ
ncbi:MAG: 4Fe-4S binding protein [Candidatus Helarchaeota archaeon]